MYVSYVTWAVLWLEDAVLCAGDAGRGTSEGDFYKGQLAYAEFSSKRLLRVARGTV